MQAFFLGFICFYLRLLVRSRTRARSGLRGRMQGHGGDERGPLVDAAGDRQPAAVAGEDMLDDGEAETGAVLGPALGRIDPVETLGQPRQVLGPNAVSVVPHGQGALL